MRQLARNWWLLTLRGVAAVLFGVLALARPGASLFALVILFGAYAFADGIFAVAASFRAAAEKERWWTLALEGALGIGVGLLTFSRPQVTALVLLVLVAVWSLGRGVLELVAAVRLRKELQGELLLGLSGLLSIGVGMLLLARPAAGLITLTWLIGLYAIFFGLVTIALSLRLRSLHHARAEHGPPMTPQPV